MGSTDPIRRVSVVSTGTVAIRPEHVGPTWKSLYVWLFTSRRWTGPRPINVYVIEHRDGLVLFDTGQDRASVTDPGYFPGGLSGLVYSRLAKFDIGPGDVLPELLAKIGYSISDVSTAVLSHLHQDHIGGLPELGHAEIVVSRAEWHSLMQSRPEIRGYLRSHIQLPGLHWRRVAPEPLGDPGIAPFTAGHDLFGDGSLLLLPTHGHTPGSMSMLIRRPDHAPLLLCGDVTYDDSLLTAGHVPGAGNKRQMQQTAAAVNALRQRLPKLAVLPAHDPGAAGRLAAALHPHEHAP